MVDQGVVLPTTATSLLESLKKWLTNTPWESTRGADNGITAATVLCDLLDVSRLRHLLYTATPKETDGNADISDSSDGLRRIGQCSTSTACLGQASVAEMNCRTVRQRFQSRLEHSDACVRKLYRATAHMDAILSSKTLRDACGAPAAQASRVRIDDIDVADMFWSLILYTSAALCWRQRRLAMVQQCTDAYAEDVVSSSRSTSERHPLHHPTYRSSQPESTRTSLSFSDDYHADPTTRAVADEFTAAGATGNESFAATFRLRYGLGRAVGENDQSSRCRSVLERLLPLLECCFSMTQLWRQPYLFAALDVLARGFAAAESSVHACFSRNDAGNTSRCPLCYAAALDNELAVEALVHLRYYAAVYQRDENSEPPTEALQCWQREGKRDSVGAVAELNVWESGWVAACRIALWNNCRASLDRLCCAPVFSTLLWEPQSRGTREKERGAGQQHGECRRMAALEALWISWWRAEVLVASYPPPSANKTMSNAIVRSATARWRSALLFIQLVLPATGVATREPRIKYSSDRGGAKKRPLHDERSSTRVLLAHLVQLPLATKPPEATVQFRQDKNSEQSPTIESLGTAARGTVFHWLLNRGDVSLVALLCRTLEGRTSAMVSDQKPANESMVTPTVANTASRHTNQAYFVELGTGGVRCDRSLDGASEQATLHIQAASSRGAATCTPDLASQLTSQVPGRSLCNTASSLWGLQLVDTLGRNALDIACRRHHLPCVRLLLQTGLSPNSLAALAYDKQLDSLPLPLLKLLYDPSLLERVDSTRSAPRISLAERLRQSTCPATVASRALSQLSYRLWTEKVQHLSMPQACDGDELALGIWRSAYVQCQEAQDRVLRPAMAALELDAHEPTARLVILSVLTRKLNDWLTTTSSVVRYAANDLPVFRSSSSPRGGEASSETASTTTPRPEPGQPSLRQLRLQHTVALRMYTQLTSPLGRALLRRAVDARCAVCEAIAARDDRAASLLLAASAAATLATTPGTTTGDDKVSQEEKRDTAVIHAPTPPLSALAPTEARKQRQQLLHLYLQVLADAHALDEYLAAEQEQLISAMAARDTVLSGNRRGRMPPQHQRVAPISTNGIATLLCGRDAAPHAATMRRPRGINHSRSDAASPLYALAVIPSVTTLQWARWQAGGHRPVEPTMWAFGAPQTVWLRLPDGVEFDRLLSENSGGAFGVVADEMPPTAAVQRGDLATFRCSTGGGDEEEEQQEEGDGDGASGNLSGRRNERPGGANGQEQRRRGAQFVVEKIFSDWRTLPYLACRVSTTENDEPRHHPPPSSLTLPFATVAAASSVRATMPSTSAPPQSIAADPRHESITLHACCVPVSYVARMITTQRRSHDPLDWLSQTRGGATLSPGATEADLTNVLMALQLSVEWSARWTQMVWAGYQSCWLEEMHALGDGMAPPQSGTSKGAQHDVVLLDANVDVRKRQGENRGHRSSCVNRSSGRDVVHLTDPFPTWDDGDSADAHGRLVVGGGRRSLGVLLDSRRCDTVGHESRWVSRDADWPSRAEGSSAAATPDVVSSWCAMLNPDVCTGTAEPAPASSSPAPQQRPPDTVTVPVAMQSFYKNFMTLLRESSHRGAPTATASPAHPEKRVKWMIFDQDDAPGRLTSVQEDTLGVLLWQWLGLFSLAVPQAGAPPRHGASPPRCSAAAKVPTLSPTPRPYTLRPHDVERLFHTGFTSLLPSAGYCGAGGTAGGGRLPPADPPAPWHNDRLADRRQPTRILVSALSSLSRHGPLFSSWCALCYTCVDTLLLLLGEEEEEERTFQGDRDKVPAATSLAAVGLLEAENIIRAALQRLLDLWDSVVALPTAWSDDSNTPDTPGAQRSVSALATASLWATVYKKCTRSDSDIVAVPIMRECICKGTREPRAPPLPLSIWSAQWHRECTRIASGGADSGFHVEEAGVPAALMTRVMRHMCERLKTEVARCLRLGDGEETKAPCTCTEGFEEVHAKTAVPQSSAPSSYANAAASFPPTLRVGTLTALSLQSPMNLIDRDADRRNGAAKRPRSRRGGAPARYRRRSWHANTTTDDGDRLSTEDLDDGDGGGGTGGEHTSTHSAIQHVLLREQVSFQLDVASGVLTTFSMCPTVSSLSHPADQCYIPSLTGMQFLRNGTVHWWTLSDSRRHRQLLAESRNT